VSLKPLTKPIKRRQETLKTTTLREFSGGLNVIDNDLNLDPQYSKKLTNLVRGADGAITLRYGTKLFCDFAEHGFTGIVNQTYYNSRIVVVDETGMIGTVDGIGNTTVIWNQTLANALPGTPNGWGTLSFCSFAQFNGQLIICNGIDKPVIVDRDHTVDYLQDLASGSNVNVPVCRYVAAASRYLVMAGDPFNPDRLHISNVDTSGTWEGDADPNDGTSIDLGSVVPAGSSDIKGIGVFRDKVSVEFEEARVIVELGIYDNDGNHTPNFNDPIEQYGSVSHRAIQSVGDDLLFCDIVGVNSIRRSTLTETIVPERLSQLIDPEIQKWLNRINTVAALEDNVFSGYNRTEQEFMLFIPNQSFVDETTETPCFVWKKIKQLKVDSWSEFRGWNWQSACRSSQGRVFFSNGTQLYVYGAQNDAYYRDFIGDQETFSDGTVFEDGTGFSPVADTADSGVPIAFVWELPWADFDKRRNSKHARYIALDTVGNARFTLQMFVDNIYEDNSYQGEEFTDGTIFTDLTGFDTDEPQLNPALEMEFAGGSVLGYGGDFYGQYFGGGRISSDERLYAWPAKFNIAKLRVEGEAMDAIKFVSLSLMYNHGSTRR